MFLSRDENYKEIYSDKYFVVDKAYAKSILIQA